MLFLKYYPPNFLRQGLLSLCPGTHQAGLGGRIPGTGESLPPSTGPVSAHYNATIPGRFSFPSFFFHLVSRD